MIDKSPPEVLQVEGLDGRYFHSFSCTISAGSGALVLAQKPEALAELIDILGGIERMQSGTCQWKHSESLKPIHHLGCVTGEAEMIHNLKVWENLILPLQARADQKTGPTPSEIEEQIIEAFEVAGFSTAELDPLLKASPDSLGHFERTLCGLVRCHLTGFQLLVGEQLFAELDPEHAQRLLDILNWLGDRHADSGLLLLHHGRHTPDLSALSSWQPIETLILEDLP